MNHAGTKVCTTTPFQGLGKWKEHGKPEFRTSGLFSSLQIPDSAFPSDIANPWLFSRFIPVEVEATRLTQIFGSLHIPHPPGNPP